MEKNLYAYEYRMMEVRYANDNLVIREVQSTRVVQSLPGCSFTCTLGYFVFRVSYVEILITT